MTVRVVLDDQRGYPLRRAGRGLVTAAGVLLLAVGVLAAAVPLAALAVKGFLVLSGDPVLPIATSEGVVLLVATVLAVGALAARVRLVRDRRRVLLLPHRYRDEVLMSAARRALGRRWRLVALTDGTPEGKPARRLAAAATSAFLVVAAGLFCLSGGGPHRFANRVAHQVVEPAGAWRGWLGELALGVVVLAVVAALVAAAVLLVLVSGSRAVRRAGHAGYVGTYREIGPATRMVERGTRRSAVLVVADLVWQQTVARLAALSRAVLVDVSRPSERLWWEIETLAQERPVRWVLVGHQPDLGWLTAGPPNNGGMNRAERRLRQLLDGAEVLAYTTDRRGRRRFDRALRAKLTTVALG